MTIGVIGRSEFNKYIKETHKADIEEGRMTIKDIVQQFKGSDDTTVSTTFARKVCEAWNIKPKKKIAAHSIEYKVDVLIRSLSLLYMTAPRLKTPDDLRFLVDQLPVEDIDELEVNTENNNQE